MNPMMRSNHHIQCEIDRHSSDIVNTLWGGVENWENLMSYCQRDGIVKMIERSGIVRLGDRFGGILGQRV